MNYQWILLALFFVAIIWGVTKALFRPMLKNTFRLGSVIIAFLVTFLLQVSGVFENIVMNVAEAIDLASMLPGLTGTTALIAALASTFIGPIFFVFVFFVLLFFLRIIIHFVVPNKKKAVPATESDAENSKPKKPKKNVFCDDLLWKKLVSLATGAVSGLLILGVMLMPMFYLMSIVTTVTHATDDSDADDSAIYKAIGVVDTYIAAPYEDSFVVKFYDAVAISDLMNYTTKAGGKIVLEGGDKIYADDTLKNLLSHGVRATAQLTSAKSECATIQEDINALLSDPAISPILTDVVSSFLTDLEMEEPAENDLAHRLIYNLLNHYKHAEKDMIAHDIEALSNVVSVLAKEGLFLELMTDEVDFDTLLEDTEALGNIAEAISGLSAFSATLQDAFELGVEILGETLVIPENDAAAYEVFMDDLLVQMKKDTSTKFDNNTIRYYVYNCATKGVKVSPTNGIAGHSQFIAYVAHWEKVQNAFAHASEDTSYGYFTIEINGEWYIYDKSNKTIVIYSAENENEYKDKISPVAGIINALTLRSTTNQLTRDNLYTILEAYVASTNDEVSKEVATRILAKENFTSKAVTVEKMLAATNFTDWTDEQKAKDSRLCVNIIAELLGLMDHLDGLDMSEDIDAATEMLAEFELLGETMDNMKQTTCVKMLPPLFIEGIIKNEIFASYVKPSIAFQINNIVENNNKSYAECMIQIASVLKWAINTIGGEI